MLILIMQNSKNKTISDSIRTTKLKREGQQCRVFEIKIIKRKLSYERRSHIEHLFLEGKWLWNHTVSQGDIFNANRCPKSILIKTSGGFEERALKVLGSQMKQDIVDSVKTAVKGLATTKKKSEAVGKISFRKNCNSIPLRQYGNTYRIDTKNKSIYIQGLKTPIKVSGLSQIPDNADIANARLVRKSSGLYFHVVTYAEKENRTPTGIIGAVDFGIKNNFTFDDGRIVNICVPEGRRLKSNQRKISRLYQKNGITKNHIKRRKKIQRDYERLFNKKKDLSNKFVAEILKKYDFFAIQDEMISQWKSSFFGKIVQHSIMGRIKAKLKTNSRIIVVPHSFPSTQRCPKCSHDTKHSLNKRDYDCSFCGYHHDSRDQKSANMILVKALKMYCLCGAHSIEPCLGHDLYKSRNYWLPGLQVVTNRLAYLSSGETGSLVFKNRVAHETDALSSIKKIADISSFDSS